MKKFRLGFALVVLALVLAIVPAVLAQDTLGASQADYDAWTAAKKSCGRELSRSGGMKWRKDLPTRRRFVAEFADGKNENKARNRDGFT